MFIVVQSLFYLHTVCVCVSNAIVHFILIVIATSEVALLAGVSISVQSA